MFRYLFSVISLLFVIISPCIANIASSGYVDEMRDNIQAKIDKKADNANYTQNMVLQTDNSGNVVATTVGTDLFADGAIETMHLADGAVTNADLAGMIDIKKLNLGTLPTSGKHMMIWNAETQKYVFERYAEKMLLQCSSGQYDIGFEQCVKLAEDGVVNDYGQYALDGNSKNNETKYGLTPGEWAVKFSYGTIKGKALCSSTNWIRYEPGTPNETPDSGRYCWCKMTSPSASSWVFGYDVNTRTDCADACALHCAGDVRGHYEFRFGVFSSVGK